MKQKIIIKSIIMVLLCVLMTTGFLIGCAGKVPKKLRANLSEVRVNSYIAESSKMSASAITGKREDPYIIDGIAQGMNEYTVITFTPTNADNISAELTYTYTLKTAKKNYSGSFTLHPFGNSYSAELDVTLDEPSLELTVNASKDDWSFNDTVTLKSVKTDEMISWEDALMIGEEALKESISNMYEKKKLKAEIYVKLLVDPMNSEGKNYWYVAFANGQTINAVLIEPITKDILALRK